MGRRQAHWALWLLPLFLPAASRKAAVPVPLAWPRSGSPYRVELVDTMVGAEDFAIRRGMFSRLGEALLGPSGKPRRLLQPFSVAADAQGRILVSDSAAAVVHLFDSARNRHQVLQGPERQRLRSPIGMDTDATGNVYVSDSALGKIFVFDRQGRFQRFLGDLRGEGFFKRPTGLAVHPESGHLYVTDTLRHKIYRLDTRGVIESEWGRRGSAGGEFNYPTAVACAGDRVFVLDAMNFRVQVFTPEGKFISAFGDLRNAPGGFFRPKGLAVDAQRRLVFVVDALFEVVQVFSYEGRLLLAFGHGGTGPGEFRLPAGICLRPDGRILVADSYNRRIQVFHVVEILRADRSSQR